MKNESLLDRSLGRILVTTAFLGMLLLGGPTLAIQADATVQEAKPAEPEAKKVSPIFKDGQAQIVPEFKDSSKWIRHDLWVEAPFDSDGNGKPDRLHVSVVRQSQTESQGLKVPVIYVTSPYFAGVAAGGKEYFWDPKHAVGGEPPEHAHPPAIRHQKKRPTISGSHVQAWVPRGFAVVHSESPGTGMSQGCPTVGGENESLAPKAVIDWLNGRATGYTDLEGDEEVTADWCTGKVGMTGTSYNGTLPLAAATTGVDGLEAIIPIAPNTSYYHYYRSNGLIRHPGGYMGEDIDVLYDFINSGIPEMREYCDCNIRDKEMLEGFDRVTGDYNDFWAGRDYLNKLDGVKAATLMAHGFNDWNVMPEHSNRISQALKKRGVPVQIFYHQGGHGGEPPMERMNRWFTRYVYGLRNDVESDAKSWIVREGDSMRSPTAYDDYPHPAAQATTFYPSKGGNEVGNLTTSKEAGQGIETLIDDYNKPGKELAQAAESETRLLFATAPLKQPLHISGTGSIKIKVAANAKAANLSVWLVSLPYTNSRRITDNVITRGWADPQNHKSLTESEDLVPGQFYELEFELQPDDQIIPKGQQIGLMVFSSDKLFTLWPEPGTELSVDLDATELTLPIVGGGEAVRKALLLPAKNE